MKNRVSFAQKVGEKERIGDSCRCRKRWNDGNVDQVPDMV